MSINLLENLLSNGLIMEYKVFIEDVSELEDSVEFMKIFNRFGELYNGKDNFIFDDLVHDRILGIEYWLKNNGVKNFNWKKDIEAKLYSEEFLPILFKTINQKLEEKQLKIKYFENIGYCYYFIISNENFEKINIKDKIFDDVRKYDLILFTKTLNTKLKIFLRKYFDLQLNEINEYLKSEKILIETGLIDDVKILKNELNELGGETELIENLYWW